MDLNQDETYVFEVNAEWIHDVEIVAHALRMTSAYSRDSRSEVEAEVIRALLEYKVEGEWGAANQLHDTLGMNTQITVVEHAVPVFEALVKAERREFPEFYNLVSHLKLRLSHVTDQVFFDDCEISSESLLVRFAVCFEQLD